MRTSLNHWRQMLHLLNAYERCFASCARLDAYRINQVTEQGGKYTDNLLRAVVERQLDALVRRVEGELDRVTAERLVADLERRKWRDAKKVEAA